MRYTLPPALIAQQPLADRAAARLLVVDRAEGPRQHRQCADLPAFLRPGDCLVLNDTKVQPARLLGRRLPLKEVGPRPAGRRPSGGMAELLRLRPADASPGPAGLRLRPGPAAETYWCLGRPARKLTEGATLVFDHGSLTARVMARGAGAERLVRFQSAGDVAERLEALGQVPLPPYIRRAPGPEDRSRYQTVYARCPGAVAAPTAGLHVTEALLAGLAARGVTVAFVTLHVGYGTFKPVSDTERASGRLHAEWFELPAEAAAAIQATRGRGGRVIAVGTTTCRVLETCATPGQGDSLVAPLGQPQHRARSPRVGDGRSPVGLTFPSEERGPHGSRSLPRCSEQDSEDGGDRARSRCAFPAQVIPDAGGDPARLVRPHSGWTELYIRPGFEFRVVDGLITNFHLPGTSLLDLVEAFAGAEPIRRAYEQAVAARYRFYSYGDAMLVR